MPLSSTIHHTLTTTTQKQVMDGFVAIADEANEGCTQLVLRDLREAFGEELVRSCVLLSLVFGLGLVYVYDK